MEGRRLRGGGGSILERVKGGVSSKSAIVDKIWTDTAPIVKSAYFTCEVS